LCLCNKLQEKGVIVYGSDLQANQSYENVTYSSKYALVVGSEDKGIRRLTRENCDELIKIDMSEKMDSLNASVSTGILLFEIARQNKIN
jgi:23S rRNA (guanosine2251-2'-O)-methyltransferase